jgi:hypothetical protein
MVNLAGQCAFHPFVRNGLMLRGNGKLLNDAGVIADISRRLAQAGMPGVKAQTLESLGKKRPMQCDPAQLQRTYRRLPLPASRIRI